MVEVLTCDIYLKKNIRIVEYQPCIVYDTRFDMEATMSKIICSTLFCMNRGSYTFPTGRLVSEYEWFGVGVSDDNVAWVGGIMDFIYREGHHKKITKIICGILHLQFHLCHLVIAAAKNMPTYHCLHASSKVQCNLAQIKSWQYCLVAMWLPPLKFGCKICKYLKSWT